MDNRSPTEAECEGPKQSFEEVGWNRTEQQELWCKGGWCNSATSGEELLPDQLPSEDEVGEDSGTSLCTHHQEDNGERSRPACCCCFQKALLDRGHEAQEDVLMQIEVEEANVMNTDGPSGRKPRTTVVHMFIRQDTDTE